MLFTKYKYRLKYRMYKNKMETRLVLRKASFLLRDRQFIKKIKNVRII